MIQDVTIHPHQGSKGGAEMSQKLARGAPLAPVGKAQPAQAAPLRKSIRREKPVLAKIFDFQRLAAEERQFESGPAERNAI